MWKFFLSVFFLAPIFASASVGIPSGVLWCNKTDIVAGDAVTCSTVVVNPESVEARGTVEFLINAKVHESKQVFVPAGSYKNVDFSFVADEGKQEYLARVVQGQFVDQEGTPIPQSGTKAPLVTSALKLAVQAKPPEPKPSIVSTASTTASTTKSLVVTATATSPLDPKSVETKIHDVLPEQVATPVANVSVPVVKSLEEFRTGQDASNQARIVSLVKELTPQAAHATTTKFKGTSTVQAISEPLSPWGLIKEHVMSGFAFKNSPWSHLVLLLSLVWDLVVNHWWVFYICLAFVVYDGFIFIRNKWRDRNY